MGKIVRKAVKEKLIEKQKELKEYNDYLRLKDKFENK